VEPGADAPPPARPRWARWFTLATPAIANGSLFIRTATKLYRISKAGEKR
jgi:hypothetical protein